MLEKLVFRNFRCFEKSEITFRQMSVVVGNNNAGKSTLVEALRIVGEAARKFKRANYIPAPAELKLPAITKGFVLNTDNLKIDLRTVVFQYKDETFAEIKAIFQNKDSIRVLLSKDFSFAIVESNSRIIQNRTQAKTIADFDLFVMPQLGLIREEEELLSEDTIKKDLYTRLSSRHFRNELLLYKEHFDTFKDLAQTTWPGLRINELYHPYGERPSLFVGDGDFAAEIGMMGSGLQMWLQIIWFVSRCPKTATVVLDEPDVYMHPDLQRKILRIVRQQFSQVIIATHSVEIITGVEPREIVMVDKKSRRMQYANSNKAVQNVISNLGSEHNLSLVRLGNIKKCVFVEGKDIRILAKIQGILYPNSPVMVDQLPSVPLGGWSRFNEALGAARLFYEETNGEVQTFCILDRDYHTDEEINQLYAHASDNHLNLHVWEKKEIENYLLSPRALAKVAGVSQDEESYHSFCEALFFALDELASHTKGSILDQLCLNDRSKNPSYYLSQAEERFCAYWKTLEGRLSLVCGKDAISLVNRWINDKFRKRSSLAKIISALSTADISIEMKSVIDNLVQ